MESCAACVGSASLAPDVASRIFDVGAANASFMHTGTGTLTIQSAGIGVKVQGVTFQGGDLDLPGSHALSIGGDQRVGADGFFLGADNYLMLGELSAGSTVQSKDQNPSILHFSPDGFVSGRGVSAGTGGTALGSFVDAKNGSIVIGDDPRIPATGSVPSPLPLANLPVLSSDQFGTGRNVFLVRATGGVGLVTSNGGDPLNPVYAGVAVPAGAGAWDTLSDARAKTDWQSIDPESFLRGIAGMDIRSWRYKTQAGGIRHVGPTAQDFRAAFGLGTNDTTISTVDADGASMLAIQALAKRTDELQHAIEKIDSLEKRLAQIESLLSKREQ